MFRNHPPGLKVLFFTEMWERFDYYLLIGILMLYMTDFARGGLGFDKEQGASVYGWFIALVYLTPFFGGVIADQVLGYRKSVVLGGLLMAVGYLGIALLPGLLGFYAALGLIVVGNGFFKPNMSTMVGRLYPEGSPLKDTGYNIFYMGINVGAFACNFVAAILRNRFGWGYAFAAAGIGMLIGVLTFILGQKPLADSGDRGAGGAVDPRSLVRLVLIVFLPAVAAGALGYLLARNFSLGTFFTPGNTVFVFACLPIVLYYVLLWARASQREKGPIGAILAMSGVAIAFWMV